MALIVRKSGILDTIQDLGRFGFMQYGVNPGGAMDRTALRLLNVLLRNNENEAIIECHFPAGEYEFDQPCIIALGGADFTAEIDGNFVPNWKPLSVAAGSILRFRQRRFGYRACLALQGEMRVAKWLGSKSTNLTIRQGGFDGRKLEKGDVIESAENEDWLRHDVMISGSLLPFYSKFPTLRVIRGPEFEMLERESQEKLFSLTYCISSESSRMGYSLKSERLTYHKQNEFISSAVTFGTVQLLPDCQLIVLMADHQTTGGYPRIATVIEQDLPLLAQIGPNDKLAFHLVSLEEAERVLAEFEQELAWLKVGARFVESKIKKV